MDHRKLIQKGLDYIEDNLQTEITASELADARCIIITGSFSYAATAVLSESFGRKDGTWLQVYRNIIRGYDSVAHLTQEERRVIPYVILANQLVCVAWFAQQEKYAELFETNKRMTQWLLERLGELKDI